LTGSRRLPPTRPTPYALACAFAATLVLLLAPAAGAQTAVLDTLSEGYGWHTELRSTLNLSQAAYANWQEGGLDALAATANTNGRFARVRRGFRQRHDVRLAYGVLRQDTLSMRKAVDILRYAFDLQLPAPGAWRPTVATELRTQFAPGYDYDPSPARTPALAAFIVPGQRLKVSDAFAPATWTQSVGVAYEPQGWFRGRAGLAARQTIVHVRRLRPVYGNRPGEPIRTQAGLDALLEARGEPFENVHVQSRLSVFQAFTDFSEAAPDAFWENLVRLRVNSWLSVDLEVAALYDRDVTARVQLKEVLSVGLAVDLL